MDLEEFLRKAKESIKPQTDSEGKTTDPGEMIIQAFRATSRYTPIYGNKYADYDYYGNEAYPVMSKPKIIGFVDKRTGKPITGKTTIKDKKGKNTGITINPNGTISWDYARSPEKNDLSGEGAGGKTSSRGTSSGGTSSGGTGSGTQQPAAQQTTQQTTPQYIIPGTGRTITVRDNTYGEGLTMDDLRKEYMYEHGLTSLDSSITDEYIKKWFDEFTNKNDSLVSRPIQVVTQPAAQPAVEQTTSVPTRTPSVRAFQQSEDQYNRADVRSIMRAKGENPYSDYTSGQRRRLRKYYNGEGDFESWMTPFVVFKRKGGRLISNNIITRFRNKE